MMPVDLHRTMIDKFLMTCLLLVLLTTVTANTQLNGNGYEGVVVSISADVDVNPDLLTTLERILTDGSAALFGASKNQVYFKEFVIVLPEIWPRMDHYENALDLELDMADILIARPNSANSHTPYVMQYTSCGQGGRFMHLTPTYILDETVRSRYGPPGRVIVHEWGHLRYGVFDEYPYTAEEMFYRDQNTWYPTRCSEEVNGLLRNIETQQDCQIDVATGTPEENCRFTPFSDTSAVTSIMYGQYLDNVEQFCDDASTSPDHLKHNVLANNRQNRLCGYKSVWEVMRLHQDFISLSSQTALPIDTDTRPQFRYVQAHPRKRVFVLDTSGSMAGDPMTGMRLAADSFILSTVEDGSQLGIVGFSSFASILSPLVGINSDADREVLVDALPSIASGGTSIGAGLLYGIEVLNESGSFSGGSLILITDGRENNYPFIDDVMPVILESGVVVHSLSFGQNADLKIANLSQITGGRAFFYTGSQNSTGLIDGLASTVTTGSSFTANKNISISIQTAANTVTPENPLNSTFFIDSTIGKDTTLTFSFTDFIQVAIESPTGPYHAANVREHSSPDSPAKVLRIVLENGLTPGLWSYQVTTNFPEVSVLVNIQSKPRDEGQEVIRINSWLSQQEDVNFTNTAILIIYAEILRGQTPVIDATVIATVETPTSHTFDLVLLDNGRGSDIIETDGIYSANIIATDFSGNGRYNVKIKVLGSKDRTKVFIGQSEAASGAWRPPQPSDADTNPNTEPLEDFQRVSTAGEFRLNGYSPLVGDGIPPGRIVDFLAKMYNASDRTATLEWTAVGGNMDRGRAARYIIYQSLDADVIIRNSTSAAHIHENQVWRGNLSSPSAAGHREEFVVFLQALDNNENETVYMSISAVDEAGNEGESSNLVIVSDATEVAVERGRNEGSDSESHTLYLIIAGSVAFAIIVIVVIVVLVFKCKKSDKVIPVNEAMA